jgi:putative MATE family efflux protein
MSGRGAAEVSAVVEDAPRLPPLGSYGQLWRIGWPVALSTSTVTLLTLVNLFWIGHLGTLALAAVSVCGNILFIVFGFSSIVHTGALAIVSRRVGEGNLAEAYRATHHALALGGGLGVLAALVGYVTAPAVVGFFGAGAEIEAIAVPYLRIMYLGQVPLFVSVALSACYQAAGDTRLPMLINVAVVLANGIADPFFIFEPNRITVAGLALGSLGWGVNGAAIAALLASIAGCAVFLAITVIRQRPFPPPEHATVHFAPAELWHMVRIGTPASITMVARPLSTFLLLKVIASFGTTAIAAFGIAMRTFGVNWIPYSGIYVAISALVGQSLGARRVGEAERIVRRGLVVTTALGVVFCALYYGWARAIMLAFDQDAAVVAAGESFLKLIALSFLFSGPMLPLGAAMNGAGDTKPPMVIAFIANWLVKLPLAYLLAVPFGYGIDGVWLGMFVSIVFEALVMFAWYRRGTWESKRV